MGAKLANDAWEGVLTAHDHRADDVRTFAVHRITSVRPIPGTHP